MISVLLNGRISVPIDTKVFSGGEVHVKLNMGRVVYHEEIQFARIKAKLTNSEQVMRLLMVCDALRQTYHNIRLHLDCDYLPYARQDRVCALGEAFSLKVFCNLINSVGFTTVNVVDCHSQVGLALLNNVKHLTQSDLFYRLLRPTLTKAGWGAIVAPDLGAHKKAEAVAEVVDLPVIQAVKTRDPENGHLSHFKVLDPVQVTGVDCLIVDDICDGGATFIGLAHQLKAHGADRIGLYVTHGIFSKGVDCLYEAGIDHIYTTNSFTDLLSSDKLTVVNLV